LYNYGIYAVVKCKVRLFYMSSVRCICL